MSEIPAAMLSRRRELSLAFLAGDGIEIGALHHRLAVGPRARVRYLDRYDVDGLRNHYPELRDYDLTPVDVMDDGETLSTLPNGQLDFLIANHFLEHTENPIGAIRNHLAKLRPGGRLYYAVPNKHNSFDRDRPLTRFEHLIADDQLGPQRSRADHYREWTKLVERLDDPAEIESRSGRLMAINYSIHFHVWDARSFGGFLDRTRARLENEFDVEHFSINGDEIVAILRKRDAASTAARSRRRGRGGFLAACWADWKGEARNLWAATARRRRLRSGLAAPNGGSDAVDADRLAG